MEKLLNQVTSKEFQVSNYLLEPSPGRHVKMLFGFSWHIIYLCPLSSLSYCCFNIMLIDFTNHMYLWYPASVVITGPM